MIKEGVKERLKNILKVEDIPFNIPPKKEMGDFSSAICLSLAKELRRPPIKIAEEISAKLRSDLPPYISDVSVSPPGYLNFKVDWRRLAIDIIPKIVEDEGFFGKPDLRRREKVFIEHTSVNPNKAMHIGHLRNAVLGDTVARILDWIGFSVEVCNYIDDTGVQVVDVVTALLYLDPPFYDEGSSDFGPIWEKTNCGKGLDYFCWDLYARFQDEMERNQRLKEKREDVLRKIEEGNNPVSVFAKELATEIVKSHLETVSQLSIFYDLLNWESDIIHQGFWNETFELLKGREAIRFENEGPNKGCWVVPLGGFVDTEEGVKSLDKILVRSNGSVTYTGKDIAYQLWKFGLLKRDFLYKPWGIQANGKMLWTTSPDGERLERFGRADRVINVIDTRQSYTQQVVIECLRQMGFEREAENSIHLAYEVVNLSPQAASIIGIEETGEKRSIPMSGRSGTGIKAKDFIEIVKQKVIEKADHKLEEDVASSLACAAIRYYLLRFTLENQIVFDFDEALRTTGNTGIYLEYAHARACSILRKANEKGIEVSWEEGCVPERLTQTEIALLETISDFPYVINRVGENLRVSQLAEYSFDLAVAFTNFYEHPDPEEEVQIPFIHIEDENLRRFRLLLVKTFQKVMASILNLMGMPTLERI